MMPNALQATKNANSNVKRQFLQGWEVVLDDGPHCQSFLDTQGIDASIFPNFGSVLELVYEDGATLSGVRYYSESEQSGKAELVAEYVGGQYKSYHRNYSLNRKKLENVVGTFRYREIPTHTPFNFIRDENGPHCIGGEVPADFALPTCKAPLPFQYLGLISAKDAIFNWLPFDLNLACPIYLNMQALFVDYSNPLAPEIINRQDVESWDSSHEDLDPRTEIVFEQWKLATRKTDRFDNEYAQGLAHAGLPYWVQYPDIPRCPKSGKTMRFVCQIQSGSLFSEEKPVRVARSSVPADYRWRKDYFTHLNFWGDGCLFVFFEPDSKTACYLIQNT